VGIAGAHIVELLRTGVACRTIGSLRFKKKEKGSKKTRRKSIERAITNRNIGALRVGKVGDVGRGDTTTGFGCNGTFCLRFL